MLSFFRRRQNFRNDGDRQPDWASFARAAQVEAEEEGEEEKLYNL